MTQKIIANHKEKHLLFFIYGLSQLSEHPLVCHF